MFPFFVGLGYLTFSTYPTKQAPCVFVAAKAQLTLLKDINHTAI
jgi:hypothetical protein